MDNQAELEKIEKEISRILRDDNFTLVHIQLTGYSSPEARYSTNARLSEERTKALRNYLVEKFNLPSDIIHTSYIPEDWDRLREMVEKSNLENKKEILAIIDSSDNEDAKETRLRAMPATWNILIRDYFPLLRRVDYQILYKKE